MFHNARRTMYRYVTTALLVFVIAVPVLFGLAVQSVHAQAAVTVVESIPEKTTQILEEIGKGLYASALGGLVQGASYFMRKLAYDAATALSSGDKGQQPLAITTNFGKYIAETAQDGLAEAISGFGTDFGLDLCQPPDLQLQAKIKIGLDRLYNVTQGDAPKPNCSWQELSKNWREGNATGSGIDSAEKFYSALQIEQTDFGITLGLIGKLGRLKVETEKKAEIESIVGRGFKPVTDLISGKVKTPAAVIEEETKALTAKHQGELTAGQITGIYGAGSTQILPMAASVFLNTLTSNLLDKVVKDGLFPSDGGSKTGSQIAGSALDFYGATVINNKKAAEQAFNFFVTAVPVKQQNVFDVVAEFASCGTSPGIHNCVIDSGLRDALSRAEKDQPMTVREAIGLGLLHGDWPLISARHEDGATNQDIKRCYLEGYCQSNIQKLRKLRIVPVGFEIAAANSDIDKPWTLNQVINGYYDCAANGKADPAHPFCHLIDPNWILRAPVARCEAEVYGNTLLSNDSPNRRQECADISTCLLEGSNNECKGVFGYCTQEKNVWRLPGQTCKAEFATCTTYKNTRTNQLVSYLARTVDAGSCDANAAGCRAYSVAKKPNGSWVTSEEGKGIAGTQTVFFNSTIQSFACTEAGEGCSAFLPAIQNSAGGYAKQALTTTPVRLKKAPQYLLCYDTDPATPQIEYPATNAQLALLPKTDACKPFAQACIEEEIGCEMYASSDGGPNVPGIVGDFACPASCIGYDTFKQKETAFASAVFPLHFVPGVGLANMNKKGQVCSAQYEGCDQFTNLDAAAAGGEGLEYYTDIKYCERPAADKSNTKTYYSWEGSANSGYALQVHTLRPIAQSEAAFFASLPISSEAKQEFSAGAPAYAADDAATLSQYIADCNQTAYNIYLDTGIPGIDGASDSGCRALYDTAGNVFYRLLEHTVSVSAACHPLRKTESNFFVDVNVTTPDFCSQKFGNWTDVAGDGNNTPVCQRCVGGGQYQNGACVYWAIDAPNESNSCISAANGCRAYVGNGGNNIEQIALDGFEPGDGSIDAWGPKNDVSVAAEAVQVNLHSLKIDADSVFRLVSESDLFPAPAGTYELRFWARGAPQNLSIRLEQNSQPVGVFASAETPAAIGSSWKQYTLGPVTFTGDSAKDATLVFTRTLVQGGPPDTSYFLDNVELRRFDDVVYLVKNSWKTPQGYDAPAECFAADQKPSDPFPGVALGCRAYTDSKGASVATTGFEQLCRPEAVGCQALYDTQNTAEEGFVFYHARCVAAAGQVCDLVAIDQNNAPIQSLGYCTVPTGDTGCYVDKIALPSNAVNIQNIDLSDSSTVFLPPDTPEATPIFLTNAPKYQCDSKNLGCTRFGLESQILPDKTNPASFEFSDVFLINDPKQYTGSNGTLCLGENIGCTAFAANNTVQYFKDPNIYGQGLCSYKENISIGGVNRSGWFLDDVGTCSNDSEQFCTADNACASGATCQNIGTTACYPNYILPNGSYGVWSNESDNYLGRVAECDAANNRCTELLDPADTSGVYPKGKPYYVIFDEKITADVADCGEGASLKEGCVLFDKTDNPNKLFSSEKLEILGALANPKYGFVPLNKLSADDPSNNDANILLKVNRDRQCSEWLSCLEKRTEVDPSGNKVALCTAVGLCNQADPAGRCTSWVERTVDDQHVTLSEPAYVSRDTSWYAPEYSGYSIPNQYPVDTLISLSFSEGLYKNEGNVFDNNFLAHQISSEYLGSAIDPNYLGCASGFGDNAKEGQVCGPDQGGRCFSGTCVYPINGIFGDDISAANAGASDQEIVSVATEAIDPNKNGLSAPQCKAYPEQNSPFPENIAIETTELKYAGNDNSTIVRKEFPKKKAGFDGANICQNGACACSYVKAVYSSSVVDYWEDNSKNVPSGICVGGVYDGQPCIPDLDQTVCGVGGSCAKLAEQSTRRGFHGFCLQPDVSRPGNCLTWYPLDVDPTNVDGYNNSSLAGYHPIQDAGNGGELFCLDSSADGLQTYDTNQWKDLSNGKFNAFSLYTYLFSFADTNKPNLSYGFAPFFGNTNDAYAKKLYSAMSLWGWHQLENANMVVGKIANPFRWGVYAATQKYSQSIHYTTVSQGSAKPNFPIGLSDSDSYMVSTPIRTEQVSRLYFEPLVLPRSETVLYKGAYIDFDELRNLALDKKNKDQTVVMAHRPLGVVYTNRYLTKNTGGIFPLVGESNISGFQTLVEKYTMEPGETIALQPGDPFFSKPGDTVTYMVEESKYINIETQLVSRYEIFPFRFTHVNTGKPSAPESCNVVTYGVVIPIKEYENTQAAENDLGNIKNIIASKIKYSGFTHTMEVADVGELEYLIYFKSTPEDIVSCPQSNEYDFFHVQADGVNSSYGFGHWEANLKNDKAWSACDPIASTKDECSYVLNTQTNQYGRHFFDIKDENGLVNSGIIQAPGPALGYVLEMKPQCTDYVLAHDGDNEDDPSISSNKAWTNRVWAHAAELPIGSFFSTILKSTPIHPYGSISMVANVLKTDDDAVHVFDNFNEDGIPYRCSFPALFGGNFSTGISANQIKACQGLINKQYDKTVAMATSVVAKNTNANVLITELFAKTYYRKSINTVANNWLTTDNSWSSAVSQFTAPNYGGLYDGGATLDSNGLPPQIYSLNSATCFDGNDETLCTAAEKNNITINGKNGKLTDYDKDQFKLPDEDQNFDGQPDEVIGDAGQLLADMNFFAFADDNRMPIRRVLVDWGDDAPILNDGKYGRYQNRKPFCGGDNGVQNRCADPSLSALTCSKNADCLADGAGNVGKETQCAASTDSAFGNADRACRADSFSFQHTYLCRDSTPEVNKRGEKIKFAVGELPTATQNRLKNTYNLSDTGIVCAFTPRVQALDNWGWCNGECVDLPTGNFYPNGGCYESVGPQKDNQCDSDNNLAWTKYQGTIIVVPKK